MVKVHVFILAVAGLKLAINSESMNSNLVIQVLPKSTLVLNKLI